MNAIKCKNYYTGKEETRLNAGNMKVSAENDESNADLFVWYGFFY